jgi:hypothetical protein
MKEKLQKVRKKGRRAQRVKGYDTGVGERETKK